MSRLLKKFIGFFGLFIINNLLAYRYSKPEFINNNFGMMSSVEIARIVFGNDELTNLNQESRAVDEYVKMYGLQSVSVKMIWSNIQNVGSILIEHRHPGSIVSGALYINVGDECKLYFHNPNPYIYSSQYAERTDYNYEFQWLKVENGQLVLFPSWLKHGKYSEIIKMDGRMVVSFNCE